jgi:hypothetical protein
VSITLKELKAELKKVVDAAVKRDNMKAVVEDLNKEIIARTKSGKGITKHNGAEKTLPELTKSTIRFRRYKGVASDTTPETSNLTETGKLLQSTNTVAFRAKGEIRIKTKKQQDKTERLLSVKSKKYGTREFKWFGLTKKQIGNATKSIQKMVDVAVRRFNNK